MVGCKDAKATKISFCSEPQDSAVTPTVGSVFTTGKYKNIINTSILIFTDFEHRFVDVY